MMGIIALNPKLFHTKSAAYAGGAERESPLPHLSSHSLTHLPSTIHPIPLHIIDLFKAATFIQELFS